MPPIQLLLLEKFRERLHNRIVVWVAGCRERLHDIPPIQKASKQIRCILTPTIEVKQHRLRVPSFQIRLFCRLHHQLCVRFAAYTPGNDLLRKQAGEKTPRPGRLSEKRSAPLRLDGLGAHLRQLLVSLVALPGLLLRLLEERVSEVREALLQGRVAHLAQQEVSTKIGRASCRERV